ncbi:hydrogenase maturation protease [Ferrimicrobium sp.]|uniref:hydrogenase maturation protease n=1 Tax=Ferrimicrobium sp. TaxID=2926050 RepID=UPI00262F5B79|nr:hydrogenase maturation protease [Ferrimicrobium sp.]
MQTSSTQPGGVSSWRTDEAYDRDFEAGSSRQEGIVIVGCGNLLRGDDAIGPVLIRELFDEGYGERVTLVDGGTAGMDIAFKMRGASKVIMIDASRSDAPVGSIFRVPGEDLEHLPDLQGFQSHAFRWDHALAFARWLLPGDEYPASITVFLTPVRALGFGDELSADARSVLVRLKLLVKKEAGLVHEVEGKLTRGGQLRAPFDSLSNGSDVSSVGVRLGDQILDVYALSNAAVGRPLKIVDATGARGVELNDLLGAREREESLVGVFDPERASMHFFVEEVDARHRPSIGADVARDGHDGRF